MKKRIILIVVIGFPILMWIASIIKCEILTLQHGKEFTDLYQQTNMIGDVGYHKVLNYSNTAARIYYVGVDRSGGDILKFVKQDDKWVLSEWETVWSKTGSADGFMWPYIR